MRLRPPSLLNTLETFLFLLTQLKKNPWAPLIPESTSPTNYQSRLNKDINERITFQQTCKKKNENPQKMVLNNSTVLVHFLM